MPKSIPLTQGKFAIVDDADYDRISQWVWHVFRERRSGRYYAVRWARKEEQPNAKPYQITMHAAVLGASKSARIDHVRPEETLDNRRSNLRRATAAQNGMNRPAPRSNTSGYKGVSWHRQREKWRAALKVGRLQRHLGLFDEKEHAARAYDAAASEAFGEFAYLNFPDQVAA